MAAPRRTAQNARAVIPQLAWSQVSPAPIVLISGPEEVLAERAGHRLRDALKETDPALEIHDVDAATYTSGEIFTLASPSLFGELRLIRVTGAQTMSDAFLNDALRYLDAPADGAVVVLRHSGGVRGKKLLDAIRAGAGGGIEIVCAEIKRDSDRFDFARDEFRRARRQIEPGALRAVVAAFADDLAELAAACRQLVDDTVGEITEALVDSYYGGRVEANAFRVADAAIAGEHGAALVMMRHALASGADPVPMVAAFASKVRTMARVYGVRGASGQLAGTLGVAPWQVDRARADLAGWDEAGLAGALTALAAADAEVKGAGRDPVYALERLIAVIASRGSAR
ncbi:DNA polymerase III subunit delta [Gryllotalpicola sp.]|uniref:DNA polymerase III subunit delta n=1 Tax=Gryllotalpicola sp. TaxID=1932787 RepID=UPI00262DA0CA|nr:DNA polymerase III subunit delta [Gryllotalpicola sp.]